MTSDDETNHAQRLSGRAFLIGLLCVAVTGVLVNIGEALLTIKVGFLQFPPAAFGIFLFVYAVNRVVQRVCKRFALTRSETLLIYAMMLIGALTSSHAIAEKLAPTLILPKYFEDSANDWHNKLDPHTPPGLVPWDPRDGARQNVADYFFSGVPRGGHIPWELWGRPLLNWSVPFALWIGGYFCMAAILRRQWVDNERLSFPLAQLPLEVVGDTESSSFFRNRLTWIGASIPLVLYTVKTIHLAYPIVPDIPLIWSINDWLTAPWTGVEWTPINISFAAIGFFFLLPTDVVFSIWFFLILSRVLHAVTIAYNWDSPMMPAAYVPLFEGYQTLGAYLVLVASYFVYARPHLRKVWEATLGRSNGEDAEEALPYRVAVIGLALCIGGFALWLHLNGMSALLALYLVMLNFFVVGIVMARTTSEGGMLLIEKSFGPTALTRLIFPAHSLGPANLTMMGYYDAMFMQDQRCLLFSGFLDGFRIAGESRITRRAFGGAMLAAVVVAACVSVPLCIYLPYHYSASRIDGWMMYGHSHWIMRDAADNMRPGFDSISSAGWQAPVFLGVGIFVTMFLVFMRATFFWWPFHPLGYALMGSWGTIIFWFSALLAWIFKSLTMRYGGMQIYRTVRPFFLGLIIGEFSASIVAVLLNMAFNLAVPAFPYL